MAVTVTDFDSGLSRARSIMRVANVAHDDGKLVQARGHIMKDRSVIARGMDRQMVGTVNGAIGTHSDRDTERVEHIFSRGKFAHLRSINQVEDFKTHSVVVAKRIDAVSHNEFADIDKQKRNARQWVIQKCVDEELLHGRLASSVSRWPTGEDGGGRRIWKPNLNPAEFVRATSVLGGDRHESGGNTQIIVGLNDHIGAVANPLLPSFTRPMLRKWDHARVLDQLVVDKLTPTMRLHRQNRNHVFAHKRTLAEHDPSIEVLCPQCGQRFLDNGWTGFTPFDGENYGQRTWACPSCGADLHEAINRPQRVVARKFAEPSGDLSQTLSHKSAFKSGVATTVLIGRNPNEYGRLLASSVGCWDTS